MRATDYSTTPPDRNLRAPCCDFLGREIFEGDVIEHPTGESGTVYIERGSWRVMYEDGVSLLLSLQVGDRGMAVVRKRTQ